VADRARAWLRLLWPEWIDPNLRVVLGARLTMSAARGIAGVVTALYEGALSLLASDLASVLKGMLLSDVTVVGGIMIAAIGINFILDNQTVKIGNLLPALILPVLFLWLKGHGLYFL